MADNIHPIAEQTLPIEEESLVLPPRPQPEIKEKRRRQKKSRPAQPVLSNVNCEDQLLDTPEAAGFLRMQTNTLEIWRWAGKGPKFLKFGRSVKYRLSDLRSYVNDSVRTSTTEHSVRTSQ